MMAQLKNATNDIKNEIQKGVEDNGFDQKSLNDLTSSITSEINKAKSNLFNIFNKLHSILLICFVSKIQFLYHYS